MRKFKSILSFILILIFVVGCTNESNDVSLQSENTSVIKVDNKIKLEESLFKKWKAEFDELNMGKLLDWQKAYANILIGTSDEINISNYQYCVLMDLDFDNVPELLLNNYGSSLPSELGAIVTYKNNEVIVYENDFSKNLGRFGLYLDKTSNEFVWINSVYYNTPDVTYSSEDIVDFSDLENIIFSNIYKYTYDHKTEKEFYIVGSKEYDNKNDSAKVQKLIDAKLENYIHIPELKTTEYWFNGDDTSIKSKLLFIVNWTPMSKEVKEETRDLFNIPKAWVSEENVTSLSEKKKNYLLMEYAYLLSTDFNVQSVKVFDGYFDFGRLIVAYCENQKVVLAKESLEDGKLSYIIFPDKALLDKFYELEGIYNYKFEDVPKDLLVNLQNNNFDYEKYRTGEGLTSEELEKWNKVYDNLNGRPNYEKPLKYFQTGWFVDITNNGKMDVVAREIIGTGNFTNTDYIINKGNENYVTGFNYGNEGFGPMEVIKYKDLNYVVNYEYGTMNDYETANGGKYLTYFTMKNQNPNKRVFKFSNYDIGYEVEDSWYEEGYENIVPYLKDRAFVSMKSDLNFIGTGEIGDEISGTTSADYDNDGVSEVVTKTTSGGHYSGDYVLLESKESNLDNVFGEIIKHYFIQSAFLDETEYGNVLIVAYGNHNDIVDVKAFKIEGDDFKQIGELDVKTINFETVEEVKLDNY